MKGVSLDDLVAGARFLWQLPRYLRRPISVEAARAALHQRLERRPLDFLGSIRRTIYGYPPSPYRQLLEMAGCEYGDLELLVKRDGVDGALRTLLQSGVYLTVDELKGRRPVVRGNTTWMLPPGALHNPLATPHLRLRSGGSRSRGTPVPIDLAYVWDRAVDACLSFDVRGGSRLVHALWGVPGGAALVNLLEFGAVGAQPSRWFSQIDPGAPGLHPRYRWSARILHWGSALGDIRFPSPQYVPYEAPFPIIRWMSELLRQGRTPHLHTPASAAVRVCEAAAQVGADLHGARFSATSEPTTPAKLATIRRSGAEVWPYYASIESGSIGLACLAPETPDEVHLLHDRLALIQAGPARSAGPRDPSLPATSLLLTSLRPTAAPLILLNVSMGDQAVVNTRRCGCPMERLGWTTHLHTVRSFDKLTVGGTTFLDTDVIRVLEEVLPARFGGGPTDYQLVQGEGPEGPSHVRLLVHPALGPLDPETVAQTFIGAISQGSGAERVMGLAWQEARLLRVERRAPHMTAVGKILHLHVERRQPGA